MRVSNQPGKLLSSMHFGRDAAVGTMRKLPGTIHDITGSAEKFCLDAWPVVAEGRETLFLSVHGQFEERAYRVFALYLLHHLLARGTYVPLLFANRS